MRKTYLIFLVVLTVSATGCFHNDDDAPAVINDPIAPAPGNMDPGNMNMTDFTAFTKNLLSTTADNTDPIDIASITFEFNENEQAFDDVL